MMGILILILKDSFIAGSFILQCILNEYWESDIDIFVPYRDLREHAFGDAVYTFTPIEDFLYNIGYDGHEDIPIYVGKDEIKTHDYIKRVRNDTKINKPLIQIISIDTDQSDEFINQWTDFDICKNLYINGKLIIGHISSILNKTCDFNCTCLLEQSITRYHKYQKRGFNIIKSKLNKFMTYDQYNHKIITSDLTKVQLFSF